MTEEKIKEVVSFYRQMFESRQIPKKRIDPRLCFGEVTSLDRLSHAHYLLDGILEYVHDPNRAGKTGRHLASVQMILSFENWFTLDELMNHNRPAR